MKRLLMLMATALLILGACQPNKQKEEMNGIVNSCHVDPVFLDVDPPRLRAIRVRT